MNMLMTTAPDSEPWPDGGKQKEMKREKGRKTISGAEGKSDKHLFFPALRELL